MKTFLITLLILIALGSVYIFVPYNIHESGNRYSLYKKWKWEYIQANYHLEPGETFFSPNGLATNPNAKIVKNNSPVMHTTAFEDSLAVGTYTQAQGSNIIVIGDNLTENEPYYFKTSVGRWKMTPDQYQRLKDVLVEIVYSNK